MAKLPLSYLAGLVDGEGSILLLQDTLKREN